MRLSSNRLLKLSLRQKLILIFGVVLPLIILILGAVTHHWLYQYTMELVIDIKLKTDISVAGEVEALKTRAEDLSNQVLLNTIVQETLAVSSEKSALEQYFLYRDAQQALSTMAETDTVAGIYVHASNGMFLRSDDNFADLARTNPERYNIFRSAALSGNGRNIWVSARGNDFSITPDTRADRSSTPYLYIVRHMKSISNPGILRGVSIVQFNCERYLNALMRNIDSFGEYACIIDKQGNVLLHTSKDAVLGEPLDAELLKRLDGGLFGYSILEGEDALLLYAGSHGMNWRVVHYIPTGSISESLAPIGRFVWGALLCCALVLIAVLLSFSAMIFTPIRRLAQNLERFGRGERGVRISTCRSDEIGDLERQFNKMADDVVSYMNEVETQHRAQTQLELKVLENQINPHFLYNTLDLINWRLRRVGQNEIADMTNMLAQFFRIGLHEGAEFITLDKETEHAKIYLQICQIRYGGGFRFVFDVPEELLGCRVKKLILQPILENAILHGINGTIRNGVIQVTARKEEAVLSLCISDNGRGMEAHQLKHINALLKQKEISGTDAFGLQNINRRIVLAYGEAYGVSVQSAAGKGTCITVRLAYTPPE